MTTRTADMTPDGWDAASEVYDRVWAPFLRLYAQDALRFAGVTPGDRVLDVAAGPGTLTLLAARSGAKVIATDFSPAMIERLRRNVAGESLADVTAHVMDGQALALPDSSFDAAFSIFGLIFFPDRARGLRELWRVLRPGGKAAVTGWSVLERVRILAPFVQAVRQALPQLPPPSSPPAVLSLQDPRVFEQEMRAAGFPEVRIHTVVHTWEAPSPEAVWEASRGSPVFAALLRSLDERGRNAVRAALIDMLRQEFGQGPVRFDAEAHIGVGAK